MKFTQQASRARCVALINCALALSGCASTKALRPLAAPSEGQAVVHFIRAKYPPTVFTLQVDVNGTPAAKIADNDFVAFNVPVGANTVAIHGSLGWPYSFPLRVEKPEDIYIVVTGTVTHAGSDLYGTRTVLLFNVNLTAFQVNKDQAESIVGSFGKHFH